MTSSGDSMSDEEKEDLLVRVHSREAMAAGEDGRVRATEAQ